MEYQDGRVELGNEGGGTKRCRNGRYYYNSRLEFAEGECIELQECIEQQKMLLEKKEAKLQQKKRKLKDVADEMRKYKSRVLELEADRYFLAADNQERRAREKDLLEKLETFEKESTDLRKKANQQKRRAEYKCKHQVLKAFEWEETTANPLHFRAVCAFWEALTAPPVLEDDASNRKQRISQRDRFLIWKELTLDGWGGMMRMELEKEFVKSKQFCPMRLAKASDVDSQFNVSAASAIAHCDEARQKYERGIIPSDQTCRRVMQCVYNAAVHNGFSSFPEQENGNVWCWGDEDGRFTNGVNRYVYEVYYKLDPDCQLAPASDPFMVPLSGDLCRVSVRGKSITMCGVKQADRRLPSQKLTGKTMNQSRHMYTPAMAGYKNEASIMPLFKDFVQAFREIENRGYCVVDNEEFKVNIHSFVVADMAFEHKYLQRGGGSGSTTCFCMFCSNPCHFRHKGYPGGCWNCRKLGIVYDEETGVQICLHHDPCTPEFLDWEKDRFEDLSCRVGGVIPKSKLPLWESVSALRMECVMRAENAAERAALIQKTTKTQLEKWLLGKCRRKLPF